MVGRGSGEVVGSSGRLKKGRPGVVNRYFYATYNNNKGKDDCDRRRKPVEDVSRDPAIVAGLDGMGM